MQLKFDMLMSWVCVLCRGGTEEATGRNQCGLPAAGAGEGAEQEDRPGAEDERGGQVQVRHADRRRAEYLENNRWKMKSKALKIHLIHQRVGGYFRSSWPSCA